MSTKLNPIALAAILGASVGVAGAHASDPPREREEAHSDRRGSEAAARQLKIGEPPQRPSRQYKLGDGATDPDDAVPSRQYKLENVPARQLKIESPSRQIKITDQPSRQIKIDGVDGEQAERPDLRDDGRQRRPQ